MCPPFLHHGHVVTISKKFTVRRLYNGLFQLHAARPCARRLRPDGDNIQGAVSQDVRITYCSNCCSAKGFFILVTVHPWCMAIWLLSSFTVPECFTIVTSSNLLSRCRTRTRASGWCCTTFPVVRKQLRGRACNAAEADTGHVIAAVIDFHKILDPLLAVDIANHTKPRSFRLRVHAHLGLHRTA